MNENYSHEGLEALLARLPARTLRARILLNVGVDAFVAGNLTLAEAAFQESIRTAEDSVTRNTGRLYLAILYCHRHLPGRLKDAEEARENDHLLTAAESLYREVLASSPHDRERGHAEEGLAAVQKTRSLVC